MKGKSEEVKEIEDYSEIVNSLNRRSEGPKACRCGNNKMTWGGNPVESIIHCAKCGRFLRAPTLSEVIANWNSPSDPPKAARSS